MLASFECAAGILIISAVRCVDDNQIQPFQSDKFPLSLIHIWTGREVDTEML